jgi:hypothetical protein
VHRFSVLTGILMALAIAPAAHVTPPPDPQPAEPKIVPAPPEPAPPPAPRHGRYAQPAVERLRFRSPSDVTNWNYHAARTHYAGSYGRDVGPPPVHTRAEADAMLASQEPLIREIEQRVSYRDAQGYYGEPLAAGRSGRSPVPLSTSGRSGRPGQIIVSSKKSRTRSHAGRPPKPRSSASLAAAPASHRYASPATTVTMANILINISDRPPATATTSEAVFRWV